MLNKCIGVIRGYKNRRKTQRSNHVIVTDQRRQDRIQFHLHLDGLVLVAHVPHQVLFPPVLADAEVTVELRRNANALVSRVPQQIGLAQIVAAADYAVEPLVRVAAVAACGLFLFTVRRGEKKENDRNRWD